MAQPKGSDYMPPKGRPRQHPGPQLSEEEWKRVPFERMKNEGSSAFRARTIYQEMGSQRTVAKVAEATGMSLSVISKYSAWFNWPEAARWYDSAGSDAAAKILEQRAISRAVEWDKRRVKQAESLYENAMLLEEKAREMLGFPLVKKKLKNKDGTETILEPVKWTMATGAMFMKMSAELAKIAIEEGSDDGFDPETATPEECAAYVKRMADKKRRVAQVLANDGKD